MNNKHFFIWSVYSESQDIVRKNEELAEKLGNKFGADSVTVDNWSGFHRLKEKLTECGDNSPVYFICLHEEFVLVGLLEDLRIHFENAIPLHYSGDFRQLESTLEFWELNRVMEDVDGRVSKF
jgi:hypothetical protein